MCFHSVFLCKIPIAAKLMMDCTKNGLDVLIALNASKLIADNNNNKERVDFSRDKV